MEEKIVKRGGGRNTILLLWILDLEFKELLKVREVVFIENYMSTNVDMTSDLVKVPIHF